MIFYLHIPKTGGQSLAARVASAFPPGRSRHQLDTFSYPQDRDAFLRHLSELDFLEAHVEGPLLSALDEGVDCLCTVREPIECLVSAYRHIRREPRNTLYRPASQLAPHVFFERFGDALRNHQSNYLVGAFFGISSKDIIEGRSKWIARNLEASLDRVRWLVPTERLDEFTLLFAVENRLSIYEAGSLNIATNDSRELDELRNYLRGRPEMWSCDFDLWCRARESYASYRQQHLMGGAPQGRAAFSGSEGDLYLNRGWHSPRIRSDGCVEWPSGPDTVSQIEYRKAGGAAAIRFNVAAYIGVRPEEIRYTDSLGNRLQASVEATTWTIDIAGLPEAGSVFIIVPKVTAPIQMSEEHSDTTRTALIADNWTLA